MRTSPRSASGRTFERTNDDMNEEGKGKAPFRGYSSPNYTPVPDELFDEQLPDLSGAELKVLLYVIRRTFGFKRESDNISLSQMLNGLRTRDGRILDRGVGLSKKTLLQAIKSLEEQAIILTERRRSQEKGDEPTSYRLNVRSQATMEETTPPVGGKVPHGGGAQIPPGGWGSNSPTQETVRQKTDRDLSKFEGSHDRIEEATVKSPSRSRNSPDVPATDGRIMPLGEILQQRAHLAADTTDVPPPLSSRAAPHNLDEREQVRQFMEGYAQKFGDEAPLSSTITRTLNIFAAADVHPARWGDYLYQAHGLTQEHTAQIRKLRGEAAGMQRKNKMPYFLATLEQLVGLRPKPPRQTRRGEQMT